MSEFGSSCVYPCHPLDCGPAEISVSCVEVCLVDLLSASHLVI